MSYASLASADAPTRSLSVAALNFDDGTASSQSAWVINSETDEVEVSSPRDTRWAISLQTPITMVLLFLLGTVIAVGHHSYYASLAGHIVVPVDSEWNMAAIQNSQEWKLRFGTAFAFASKTMLAASVAFAYRQYMWTVVRKKPLSLHALNSMFDAVSDVFSFLDLEFIGKAKTSALLAILTWLIPLSALITPAALTVVSQSTNTTKVMSVPMVNFTNDAPLYSDGASAAGGDISSNANGVTPYLARIMATSAAGLAILPLTSEEQSSSNVSYSLSFNEPSFKCSQPSPNIVTYILTAQVTAEKTLGFTPFFMAFPPDGTPLAKLNVNSSANITDSTAISTFVNNCILGSDVENGRQGDSCIGISSGYNNGTIWIYVRDRQNEDLVYNCELYDTTYNISFATSSSTQRTINASYDFTVTDDNVHNHKFPATYNAIANVMSYWLTGAFVGFGSDEVSYNTRIGETALCGALPVGNDSTAISQDGLPSSLITPELVALARNKSIGYLVEELSRNVTLSLFSATQIRSTVGASTNVTIYTTNNVYVYSAFNLLLTYAIAVAAALFGVSIGILALLKNGVSHSNSFSSILATSRNQQLDHLMHGNSLGALPLDKNLLKTKLKFGLLTNDKYKGQAKAAWGLEGSVATINKGVRCS